MIQTLHRIVWFVVLILVQTEVLNHVHIMGYATPLVFIYYVLVLNSETPRKSLLFQAFYWDFVWISLETRRACMRLQVPSWLFSVLLCYRHRCRARLRTIMSLAFKVWDLLLFTLCGKCGICVYGCGEGD